MIVVMLAGVTLPRVPARAQAEAPLTNAEHSPLSQRADFVLADAERLGAALESDDLVAANQRESDPQHTRHCHEHSH